MGGSAVNQTPLISTLVSIRKVYRSASEQHVYYEGSLRTNPRLEEKMRLPGPKNLEPMWVIVKEIIHTPCEERQDLILYVEELP